MTNTYNKQADNTNNAFPTQQQVQGSIQTQDTSPPVHQQALTTAPLDDGQSAVVLQLKSKRHRKGILIGIAIALITMGTTFWVFNITDPIKSSIFFAIFASTGVIVALIQLYLQSSSVTTTPLPPDTQPPGSLNNDFSIPRPGRQEGVLLVYTKKALRGSSVDLCRGYGKATNTAAAQNIVERKIRGRKYYIAVFRSLPPGRYTAHIYTQKLMSKITIDSGEVTEIDWR